MIQPRNLFCVFLTSGNDTGCSKLQAKQATERKKIIDVGQSATRRDFTPPFIFIREATSRPCSKKRHLDLITQASWFNEVSKCPGASLYEDKASLVAGM
jgi:hypothetical protein